MATKSNAAARLTAYRKMHEKNPKVKTASGGVELPKFRYLDDAVRFLDQMAEETRETDQLIKIQQRALAYLKHPKTATTADLVTAADMEFVINDDDDKDKRAQSRRRNKKIDPTLVKVKVDNLSKLKSQYSLAEDLYEKHRTLEAMQTQLAMQFPDRRGEAFDAAMGSIRTLTSKVAEQLKTVLGFLSDVAEAHVPKTFKQYMEAVSAEVSEHVLFEDHNLFLYVHVSDDGQLVFSYYLMLQNATNDDGKTTPHLYISIQWVVGEEGGNVQVQVNHEYEAPNKLLRSGGTSVASAGEAVKAISHLLDLEDFATSLGTIPLSQQFRKRPEDLDPNMFSYKDKIAKLAVESDALIFKLRKGVSKDEAKEIAYQLFPEVKQLIRKSRGAKLKLEWSNTEIKFSIHSVAEGLDVSTYDAEFLQEKFGLSDQVVRKVVDLINNRDD